MTSSRVLIVAGDPAGERRLEGLAVALRARSWAVTSVQSLREALPLLAGHDVVLLELGLAEDFGLAALRQLASASPGSAVVAWVGDAEEPLAAEALEAGAQDCLLESELVPALVVRSLRYAIARKGAEQSESERVDSDLAVRRAAFVAAVMTEVTRSLDRETALAGLVRLLVPRLGDIAVIDLVREDGRLVPLAQAGYDGPLPLIERASSGSVHDPVLCALERQHSVWLSELDIDTADERHRLLFERASAQAIFVTPLVVRGQAIGAITYVLGPGRPGFDADARRLAEEVAASAALAIDNMRSFEQAQRAVRGRDELLAIVSHDLRNPINVIALALSSLEQRDPGSPLLPRMKRALKRMEHLIDDLLDVARVDAGTLQVELSNLPLAPVLDEVHEQWRPLCAEKGISLIKEIAAAAVGRVQYDRHRVIQVLANLIGNASKFTPGGGSVRLGAELLGPWVKISVSDTGPGIAPENLPHVFDRFWQNERRTDGLGLGLAIASGIVKAHGGSIHVESSLGAGTSFWFTLRRADGE